MNVKVTLYHYIIGNTHINTTEVFLAHIIVAFLVYTIAVFFFHHVFFLVQMGLSQHVAHILACKTPLNQMFISYRKYFHIDLRRKSLKWNEKEIHLKTKTSFFISDLYCIWSIKKTHIPDPQHCF